MKMQHKNQKYGNFKRRNNKWLSQRKMYSAEQEEEKAQ